MASYKVIGGDQQEYGPSTVEEVEAWIAEGRLSGQSLAQEEGADEWRPLSTFPEFAQALREQAARFLSVNPALDPSGMAMRDGGISVGRCLSLSAQLVSANFGLLTGACALVWLLGIVCQFTPIVGGFVFLLLEGVLYGGLYVIYLRRIRGQPTAVGEVFLGFGQPFSQLMLAGVVTSVLAWFGLFFCVVPWIYLTVAWVFAVPLVADKQLEFWSAMELSRKRVTRFWLQMLILMVAAFLPTLLMFVYSQVKIFAVVYPAFQELTASGAQPDMNQLMELLGTVARTSVPLVMMNKIVLLFNLPFAVGALMYAYEDLFGEQRPSDN